MNRLPTVSIVGRPNVGKSSLFNRLLGRRAAVVSDREGVTRDRHYQMAYWNGQEFTLVDTGGFLPDDTVDEFADSVRQQIFTAISESDLVLFLVDARVGISKLDQEFARLVLRTGRPTILLANKGEKETDRAEPWGFLKLGLGEPRFISALNGYGMRGLFEEFQNKLPIVMHEEDDSNSPVVKFSVLGRPNAGKSTLLNRLMGQDRLITSPVPGTTRDSIDCEFTHEGMRYRVTDTAGLRKKAKVEDEVEYFSSMRSLEAVRRSDVSVLVIDATRGMEIQDFRILQQIRQSDKGMVIVLNKWDIVEDKDHRTFDNKVKEILDRDPMLANVPILSVSALEGQRLPRLLAEIRAVHANCYRVLGRDALADSFRRAIDEHPHPTHNGRSVELKRACQILVNPPVVAIETKTPDAVDEAYKRYLIKYFYKDFDLRGAPFKLNFVDRLHLRKDEELESAQ